MKIIITEDQKKLIVESKKIESSQNMVDMSFEQIKENCENNFVNQYACDEMEYVDKIEVISSNKGSTITRNIRENFLLIDVDIHYTSLKYQNFSNFVYQLQYEAREIVGARNIIINLRKEINSNNNPQF